MKFAILAVLSIALCSSSVKSESLIRCNAKPGDYLLHEERVERTGGFLQYQVVEVTYPKNGEHVEVTCLRAIDRWGDGTGGSGQMINFGRGGATIKLTSQFHRGMSFDVQFIGHRL